MIKITAIYTKNAVIHKHEYKILTNYIEEVHKGACMIKTEINEESLDITLKNYIMQSEKENAHGFSLMSITVSPEDTLLSKVILGIFNDEEELQRIKSNMSNKTLYTPREKLNGI